MDKHRFWVYKAERERPKWDDVTVYTMSESVIDTIEKCGKIREIVLNYYIGATAFRDLKILVYKAFGDIYKIPVNSKTLGSSF